MSYDDMMGLEMYDGSMEGMLNPEVIKDFLVAGVSAAGLVGAASFGLRKISVDGWDPKNVVRLRSGLGMVAGLGAAKLLYPYSRDAAMAAFGVLFGVGLVEMVSTFMDVGQAKPGFSAAPEDYELRAVEDQMAAYNDEMSALADLAAPQISAARGAFGDSTVTRVPLEAAVVQGEELGSYFGDEVYAPYNS